MPRTMFAGLLTLALLSPGRTVAGPPERVPGKTVCALYTDQEVRRLAKFDIDKEAGYGLVRVFDIPCLDVVPAGQSYPRAKVFKTLKIDEKRLRDFRGSGINSVVFLIWRVSPSYDICCMTAINDPDNEGLEMTDPRRKVYGVRLVKRPD